ncbi:MAG: NAD-dependent protein deacetylase [Candidatus Nanopelagicales bacterium]|nr:NAD-dependent protein deacetylase [Candidatus Nanopelagicales bacterium]
MPSDLSPELGELSAMVANGGVAVLSGAGISTQSGIPDYRGPSGAAMRKHAPMTFQTFTRDPIARRRYWARGFLGWRQIENAKPNPGHLAVAVLERAGFVSGVITQNVDGLHSEAGSVSTIDLHGRLDRVVCLDCRVVVPRDDVHDRIRAANSEWRAVATAINPDGDVDVPEDQLDEFVVVDCASCGGVLKPDVVYFGEQVPTDRVAAAFDLMESATALMVLGSSLQVYSGRRFVLRASARGIPVAIVNDGETKADDLATIRIHGELSQVLGLVVGQVETAISA